MERFTELGAFKCRLRWARSAVVAATLVAMTTVAAPSASASGLSITGGSWTTLQPGEGEYTLHWTAWNGTGVVVNDLYISDEPTTDSNGTLSSNPEISPIDPSTGSYTSYYTASPTEHWYFQILIDAVSCGSGGSVGTCVSNVFELSTKGGSSGTTTTTTTTIPTPTCGAPTASYPASGVFVDEQIVNDTGANVVVYDTVPVGYIARDYSMLNGETIIHHEEVGGYLFITSEKTDRCLGRWKITSTTPKSIVLSAKSTTTVNNPCIETATCVVPLLRAPTVSHGTASLVRSGKIEPLADMQLLLPNDSIKTQDGVAHLAVTAGAVAAASSIAIVIGAGSIWALPALPILVVSGTVFQFASLQTFGSVLYDATGRGLQPEVRTSEMITRVNYAACGACAPSGPIPHLSSSTSASFSVQVTKTYSRIRVYQGAVRVQNRHGKQRTVTVRAGFQSVVQLSGPPSAPGRFTIPTHGFWQ
jgi:hypothetical protein